MVQLQKSEEDQVKCQHEEWLTNPCWMSAELAVVHTALTCYSVKKAQSSVEVYDKKPQHYAEDNVMQW